MNHLTDNQLCKRVANVLTNELAKKALTVEHFNRITEIETELIYILEDTEGSLQKRKLIRNSIGDEKR